MEHRHKAEKTYLAQNAKAIALLFMENREKPDELILVTMQRLYPYFSWKIDITQKRLILLKMDRL